MTRIIDYSFTEAQKNSINLMRAYATWVDIQSEEIEIGTLEKTEVLRIGAMSLYHYCPLAKRKQATPLLIVYSQIGRYTMMDLQPDISLIRNLLEAGIDIYLIDWGNPGRPDRWMGFEDYVEGCISNCVDHIRSNEEVDQVSIFGVCEGGVLALCYAALHASNVSKLALAVTPIDFHAEMEPANGNRPGLIRSWVGNLSRQDIEDLGQLSGQLTGFFFQAMTPVKSLTKYNLDLSDTLSRDRDQVLNYFRMEKWLSDRPHHPGVAAGQWLIDLYKENRLVKGEFELDDQIVDLHALTMPVLNVIALKDHIVPPPTSKALHKFIPSERYRELELDVGHIGTFVSRKANRVLSDNLTNFLYG